MQDKVGKIPVMNQNVGYDAFGVGAHDQSAALAIYRSAPSPYAATGHNLFAQPMIQTLGGADDLAYIMSILYGYNASPQAGDMVGMLAGSNMNYDPQPINQTDLFKANVALAARGLRGGVGRLIHIQEPGLLTGTITSAFYDRGAAAASGTTKGCFAQLQCTSPSGVQATNTLTVNVNPADGDTATIGDGVTTLVYRYKTVIIAANDILIGGTTAATALNTYYAMIGSQASGVKGVSYFAGTARLPATMTVAKPAANILTLTAVLYGTGPNAYTLARTGTGLVVGGATFTGGLAGDSYVVTLQSATTSGGAYTAFLTFVSTLQQIGAERLEILPSVGTTVNRFIKAIATTGGTTNKPGFNIALKMYWQN